MTSLTYLSIGNMGAALVRALLKANTTITAWNRTPTSPFVQTIRDAGAAFEADLATAVSLNGTIMICTLNYDAVKATLASLPTGALKNKVLINFTNGTPGQAEEMQKIAKEGGVAAYFDGAILVPPYMVGGPGGSYTLCGETQSAFDGIKELLAPVGQGLYHGSEIGASSRFDNAMLVSMYGMFSGGFLAMGILKQGAKGEKSASVMEALVPMVQALVPLLPMIAQRWDGAEWDNNDGHPMGMQVEGLMNIKKTCEESGIDFGPLAYFTGLMERAVAERGGNTGLGTVGPFLIKE